MVFGFVGAGIVAVVLVVCVPGFWLVVVLNGLGFRLRIMVGW